MADQLPDQLEPGVIFDHGHYPPDELDAEVVALAWRLGWRGRDARDADDIRSTVMVAGFGDPEPNLNVEPPHSSPANLDPDDELAVAEHLTWAADDAVVWLNYHYAPPGHWIGNDGEAGAFGVWWIGEQEDL